MITGPKPHRPTMAVIDEDTFSNIPWNSGNSASGAAGSSSSTPTIEAEQPSAEDQHHGDNLYRHDPGLSGDILECTVSEPRKEQDGTKDAFVSYLITTNVSQFKLKPRDLESHHAKSLTTAVYFPLLPEAHIHLPPPLYRFCLPLQNPLQRVSSMCRTSAAG